MSRVKGRATLLAVVFALSLLAAAPAGAHTQCAHNSTATGTLANWTNNWWIGYDSAGTMYCWYHGHFTTGIQRINWAKGYRQSGIDGYYGSNTHQDVRSFQAFHGLTVDGLVGHQSWLHYASEISYVGAISGMEFYKVNANGQHWFGRITSTQVWRVINASGSGFVNFSTAGPS